jgi:hypothetical protein
MININDLAEGVGLLGIAPDHDFHLLKVDVDGYVRISPEIVAMLGRIERKLDQLLEAACASRSTSTG